MPDETYPELEAFALKLAEIAADEQIEQNKLLSRESLLERYKEEFSEAMSLKETEIALEQAVVILNIEGPEYPDQAKVAQMAQEFTAAMETLKKNPESLDSTKTIQEQAGISDSSLQLVADIARKKFIEGEFAASKALFLFLTVLNSTNFDYWHSLGMAEQELKEYENAASAYENGWLIRQDVAANRLFLTECAIKLQDREKASTYLLEAKALLEGQELETWSDYINLLEEAIASES